MVLALPADRAASTVSCDRYASPSGDDAASGSFSAPVQTVARLVHSLSPGETGCLRGYADGSYPSAAGLYEEDPITVDVAGITLRSAGGEVAQIKASLTITADDVTVSHLVLDGRNADGFASPRITGDRVTLTHNNITSRDTADCVTLTGGADHIAIAHNRIHDCNRAARVERARYALITDSLVYDNRGAGVHLSPAADAAYVARNIVHGNGSGIVWGSGVPWGTSNVETSDESVAAQNVVSASNGFNVTAQWHDPDGGGPAPHVAGTTNIAWSNCLHHSKSYGGVDRAVTSSGWDPHKVWMPSNTVADPGYADAARGDFRLGADSPCAGTTGDLSVAVEDDGPGADDNRPDELEGVNLRPNVLVIMTDDQRAGGTVTNDVMPDTLDWFKHGTPAGAPGGTEFADAFATTPMCCPSRASIFTGQYAHNHGVNESTAAPPPWIAPDDPTYAIQPHTLQRYLRERAGYRTGLFGKFLNSWRFSTAVTPPNFDDFGYFQGEPHCPFSVMEDPNTIRALGSAPVAGPLRCEVQTANDYSTTWIGQEGRRFIEEAEQADAQPWLLYLDPVAPHDDNFANAPVPEDRYAAADVPPPDDLLASPGFREGLREPGNQLTDKPLAVQNWRPPCDPGQTLAECDAQWTATRLLERTRQLQTLMSVDDLVQNVFAKLEQTGEADDTLAFFISDNGWLWGEHGMADKGRPYLEAVKIPFFMRWPDNPLVARGATDASRIVANIDVAPTVLDAVDVVPDHVLDGRSLIDPAMNRTRILTELARGSELAWSSLTDATSQYTEFYRDADAGFREYYRFPGDLAQLTNLFGDEDPADPPAAETDPLAADLWSSRVCAGSTCP